MGTCDSKAQQTTSSQVPNHSSNPSNNQSGTPSVQQRKTYISSYQRTIEDESADYQLEDMWDYLTPEIQKCCADLILPQVYSYLEVFRALVFSFYHLQKKDEFGPEIVAQKASAQSFQNWVQKFKSEQQHERQRILDQLSSEFPSLMGIDSSTEMFKIARNLLQSSYKDQKHYFELENDKREFATQVFEVSAMLSQSKHLLSEYYDKMGITSVQMNSFDKVAEKKNIIKKELTGINQMDFDFKKKVLVYCTSDSVKKIDLNSQKVTKFSPFKEGGGVISTQTQYSPQEQELECLGLGMDRNQLVYFCDKKSLVVMDPNMKLELKKYFMQNEPTQKGFKEDVSRIQMSYDRRYCYWWRGNQTVSVISCDNVDIIRQYVEVVPQGHTLIRFRVYEQKNNMFILSNLKKQYTLTKYDLQQKKVLFVEKVKSTQLPEMFNCHCFAVDEKQQVAVIGGCSKRKNWKQIQPFIATYNLQKQNLKDNVETQIFQMLDYSIYRVEFAERERHKNRRFPTLIATDFSQDLVVFEWHQLSEQWEIQHHIRNIHSNRISQLFLNNQTLITSSADHTINYVQFAQASQKLELEILKYVSQNI